MTLRTFVIAGALACLAAAPASRVTGPAAAAVAAGAQMLGTVAEGSPDGALTWAAWTEQVPPTGLAQDWMLHLVLLRQEGATVRPTWQVLRRGGYEPVLRVMPWDLHGHPVLLLQFQYGAADMRMELYAVESGGLPVLRGSLEGSLIDIARRGPDMILSAHESSDLQDAPQCYGWDEAAGKLSARPC